MSDPATDHILFERRDDIAHVTFNRPAQRNAFTFAMYEGLADICTRVDADPSIRAMILTGAGDKAFAAGTDIAALAHVRTAQDGLDYEARIDRVLGALESCRVPTIAAIAGACTGGGAAIAASCDLRIATADLKFGFPIARTLGNCLSISNYARLFALLGPARTKEIIFMARLVGAEEARSLGLVSEILPDHAALMARADALAMLVAGHAPLTLRATKEALRRITASLSPRGEDLVGLCYSSADFREGMAAFFEKRKPQWSGR
jgi:enoyl-CoA hydratase/carnithine racemase